jgi:outer membrane protein assembly factor BamB
VIVAVLGDEVGLAALNLKTGEKIWTTGPLGTSHSTPTLLDLNGRQQVLFLSTNYQPSGTDKPAPTTITSIAPEDGTQLWQIETVLSRIPIPGPVKVDDEHIFVTGGYRGGSTLIRIENEGDEEFYIDELFHIERGAQTHAPLLFEDHLYLLVNENWNYSRRREEGGLLCLSLEGEELWRTGDNPFFGRGNAVLAGDKLLIQDGNNGVLRVVQATPDGYQQIAEANVFGAEDDRDRQMWAPMALTGGRLLMRSQDELLCVKL